MHHARQRRTLVSLPTIKPKRAEILKCIARFSELPGVSKGLPDMALDGCHRTFYSVLGFSQPKGEEAFSPFGDAVKPKITHVRSGFGLAYVAAQPGQGVLMHNHDTVESFLVIEGRWKLEWEGDPGDDTSFWNPRISSPFRLACSVDSNASRRPQARRKGSFSPSFRARLRSPNSRRRRGNA
jgi:hypothetical protein